MVWALEADFLPVPTAPTAAPTAAAAAAAAAAPPATLAEGVASARDIDRAMHLGADHPLGPLALADFVGLDITLDILDALERDLKSDRYRACPLLRDKVARGELGRKTGRGFFSYS